MMTARPHPLQVSAPASASSAWRGDGAARLEASCGRGISIHAHSVGSVRSILENGLDRAFLDGAEHRHALRPPVAAAGTAIED
jgi:hypothetical protein